MPSRIFQKKIMIITNGHYSFVLKSFPSKNSAKTVYFVHKFLLVIILAKLVHESFNHMIKYWFQYVMKITRC